MSLWAYALSRPASSACCAEPRTIHDILSDVAQRCASLPGHAAQRVLLGLCLWNQRAEKGTDTETEGADWRAEAVSCCLKDLLRFGTRYDKLGRNHASTVALAAVVAFWC